MPISLRGTPTSSFRLGAGNVTNPSLSFVNNPSTGLFLTNGNIGISVNGTESMRITPSGLVVNGNVTAGTLFGDGSLLTSASFNTYVSNVQVANSTFVLLDDTSVDTAGGFVVVNGSGFVGGSMVLVSGTPATSTTVLSYTKLGAQVPAKASGTYSVTVVRPDSVSINVPLGITYSPFPVWSTSTTLANVVKTVAFTQTVAATEATGTNVTYAVSSGSSLPANVSLASNGLLSGNIVNDPGNLTTYSFSLDAIDTQLQNIPRTFSLLAFSTLVVATGGTMTTANGYTYHTFTTSGTFTLTSNPFNKTFDILVVGGGGSGGTLGGGGGGGVINSMAISVANGTFTITVGGGGSNSVFSSYTAIAGGSGGGGGVGSNGGSGGGGGAYSGGGYGGGTGTAGQGNNGGSGGYHNGYIRAGGGGGGAGAVGGNTTQYDRGASGSGGNGLQIWGTYYGGGGGGSTYPGGDAGYAGGGGLGGGGQGVGLTVPSPGAGTANTGGGGGGGGDGAGASGGSGIVIIRYIA